MANWQRTLDISKPFQAAKDGSISVQDLASRVSNNLRALQSFGSPLDDEKMEIIEEFDYIAESAESTTDSFDNAMEILYDWADTPLDAHWNGRKVCWVKTF